MYCTQPMHRLQIHTGPAALMARATAALRHVFLLIACAIVATTPAMAQDKPATDDQQLQQIELTDAQVQGYLKIAPKLAKMFDRIDQAGDQPDKKLQSDLEALAKEGGFKSYDDLEIIVSNITFVMSGINEEDGSFQEPVEVLKEELKDIEADTELNAKEKAELVGAINESIAITPKLAHPGNVDIVKKHFKALSALFQE